MVTTILLLVTGPLAVDWVDTIFQQGRLSLNSIQLEDLLDAIRERKPGISRNVGIDSFVIENIPSLLELG